MQRKKILINIIIMNKKTFNGFASEAQYEAVMEIIKTEIDNLSDTIMIDYNQETNVVRVFVDDKVYTMVGGRGVVEINFTPNSPNLSNVYWEIFNRLNDISNMIFKTINSQFNYMENLNKTITLFDKEGNPIKGTVISTFPFSIRLENGKILNGGYSIDYTYNYNFVIYGETPEDAYYFNDAGDAAGYSLPENYVQLVYWYIKIYENNKLVGQKYYFDKDACFQDFRSFSLHFYDMQSFSTNEITYTQESGRNYWAYNNLGNYEAKLDRCINNKHHITFISTNLN